MKKLLLTAVFALGTLTAIQAQEKEVETQDPTNAVEEVTAKEEAKLMAKADAQPVAFKEIKATELPAPIVKALANDFEGATVQKAYVNDKQEYKLVLTAGAANSKAALKTVFASKDGAWIKKPKAMQKQ